jgi:hypothetical protein
MAAALLFTILMRIFTPQMILTGGEDAADTWIAAKWILYGNDYVWNHTTARFGTIIPVYISQLIFGTSPLVYYIAPAIFQIILIIFLFRLTEQIIGGRFALVVCAFFLIFPESVIAGSHPRTSTFSMTFLVISLYYFHEFFRGKRGVTALFISASAAFMMYLSNELTVFFLPGFAISILMMCKGWKPLFIFAGTFTLLFSSEFILYRLLSPFPFGRMQIAMQNHLGEVGKLVPVEGPVQLLNRFSFSSVSPYWTFIIPVFLISAVYLLLRKRSSFITLVSVIGISFIVFITFAVKSLHPITPIVNFRMRYLADLTPVLIIVLCGIVYYLLSSRTDQNKDKTSGRTAVIAASLLVIAGIVSSMLIYTKKYYSNYNYFSVYPPKLVHGMYRDLSDEFAAGVPVIVRGKYQYNRQSETTIAEVQRFLDRGIPLNKALENANIPLKAYDDMKARSERIFFIEDKVFERFFWDERKFTTSKPPVFPSEDRFTFKSREYSLYSIKPVADKLSLFSLPYVIELDIKPFRYKKIPFSEIVSSNTGEPR